jgi:hypothetical protein
MGFAAFYGKVRYHGVKKRNRIKGMERSFAASAQGETSISVFIIIHPTSGKWAPATHCAALLACGTWLAKSG